MNGFASFHPFTCFFYYTGVVVLVMTLGHPVFLTAALVMVLMLNFLQDRGKGLRSWTWTLILLPMFIVIINPLINRRGTHILFYLHENPVMLEAVVNGINIALSLLCLLVMFISFNAVITGNKFLFIFAKVVPQWALLAMLTMRFVPLFKRRLQDIRIVQNTKGLTVSHGSLRSRANSGILLVQILLSWSLEEAIQTADSMKARGYGTTKRTAYTPYRFEMRDWFALLWMGVFGGLSIWGALRGYGKLAVYPQLETIPLHQYEPLFFLAFLLYLSVPVLIEGREQLRWRFSN